MPIRYQGGVSLGEQTVTYEVIFKVCMHIIDSVVHDSCCDALAGEAQRPRGLHVQIKLRYSTSLTGIVLRTQYNSSIYLAQGD